jgi:CheY-like chemotaxis protein
MARDSTEAMSLLQRFDPDLVFIDAELAPASPLDGLALARRVRADYATRVPPLPVFALASRIGEVDRVRATLAGCDALLAKPPADPELAALLARHGIGRADVAPAS